MRIAILIAFLSIFSFSCRERKPVSPRHAKKSEIVRGKKTIVLQPFIGFPSELTDSLFVEIKKINPKAVLNEPIPLPANAYYMPRGRYRADSLIEFLWKKSTVQQVIIGLTEKDISTTKGREPDWGVMGLAYKPGYSCVVSTYRLSKKNTREQLYKLSLHELAHTQGLPHCRQDSTCYMSDANGENPWDAETGFCSRCKAILIRKGWILN